MIEGTRTVPPVVYVPTTGRADEPDLVLFDVEVPGHARRPGPTSDPL